MVVDDSGLEALRKAADQVTPGSAADYYIKTRSTGLNIAPALANAATVEYPSATSEVIKYRSGGISGTILKTVTVTYTDSTKRDISSWVES